MLVRLEVNCSKLKGKRPCMFGVTFDKDGHWAMECDREDLERILSVIDANCIAYSYCIDGGKTVQRAVGGNFTQLTVMCPAMGEANEQFLGVDFNEDGFWTRNCTAAELDQVLKYLTNFKHSYRINNGPWKGSLGLEPSGDVSDTKLKVTKKEDYATGAVRGSDGGRGRYDLISDRFLRRLAIHLEKGAKHYEPRNWEKGLPLRRSFGSMIRHSYQWLRGDRDEDHLAAVACNIMFLIHTEELIQSGDLTEDLLADLPVSYLRNHA